MLRQAFSFCTAAALAGSVILASPAPVLAETEPPRMEQTLDLKGLPARWAPLLDEFLVPGMAVVVVKDGKLLAVECFGTRDAARSKPVTPDTMFYIASITKTYTATLVCMLAEQGQLSLDDPVKKHLPRFKLADAAAPDSLTIRDLLTHKAGLQSGPIVLLDAYTGDITEDRYYALLAEAKPDPSVNYSNIHYTLLGRVVEAKTGKPWRDALEQQVFIPAGMTRTTGYASRMYSDPDHAEPMEWLPGRGLARAENVKVDSTMHAAGGLGTTATDMGRWLCLHLANGTAGDKRLLSAAGAAEMRREQDKYPAPQGSLRIRTGHGLAWETGTFTGKPLLTHGGGYEGASAYAAMLPDQNSGFAILMNSGGPATGLADVIAIDLLNRLTGQNVAPDLLKQYVDRARSRKAEAESGATEIPTTALPASSLSSPLAAYAGDYTSRDWGDFHITPNEKSLRLAWGACVLRIKPAAGADAFTITGPTAQRTAGRFEKSADGKAVRLILELPQGEIRFER